MTCSNGHPRLGNNTTTKSGKMNLCTICLRARELKYKDRGPTYARNALLRKYGLDTDSYDLLLTAQGGHCPICNDELKGDAMHRLGQTINRRPHIDHDHETGTVRGILCHKCNTAIGLLGENAERVKAAHEYLMWNWVSDCLPSTLKAGGLVGPDGRPL